MTMYDGPERVTRERFITTVPECEAHLSAHWDKLMANAPIVMKLAYCHDWFRGYPEEDPVVFICLECGEWIWFDKERMRR